MHKPQRWITLLGLFALVSAGALTGCGGQQSDMSKEDQANFKSNGKGMPPEAAAAIAKQKQGAQAKAGASGAPPESVPGAGK